MPDTPPIAAAQSARPPRFLIGGLGALAVAIGIGRFLYTPILPSMMAALGLSKFAAGLIASANFAGYLAGAILVAGPRLSTRRWVLGGLLASAATTGAMGFAHSVMLLVILRAAGGMASAIVLILASEAVLQGLAEIDRSELGVVMFAGVGTGIVASALLVSALRAIGFDWSGLWIAGGALSLLAVWASWSLIPDCTRHPAPLRAGPEPRDRRFTRLIVAYGLFGFGYIITATYLVAIVRSNLGTRAIEPMVWVVFGVVAIPSVFLWGAAGRRWSAARAFALAALAEAVGVLGTVLWRSDTGIIVGTVLVGGTFMGLTALGLARGRELARNNPQRGLAVMTGAFGLGQIVGPTFAGALSDRLGNLTVASVTAAAALVASAVLITR
ncbi:MAG: YbfB/YjiJ family MFS transporter [Steroidobacteraceae bacterium]